MAAAGEFSQEEGLARALLSWFKRDFFTWTNKPPCSGCGARGPKMQPKAGGMPTSAEMSAGAARVEVYECNDCHAQTRFPRYNNPAKLLETRTGRCGEWANCFTLMCRAVGLEARLVVDWTDHVWTEIWIPEKNRWLHADPCENKLDKPLMYERGWNKRLSYVLAFDRDGAVDVTGRYTRQWLQVLSRRSLVPEAWLAEVLDSTAVIRKAARTAEIAARLAEEQLQLRRCETMSYDNDDLDIEEKEGRLSGDAEWVASRGEGGEISDPSPASAMTPCAMIGAPLGILHSGGGLSLSVAAVLAEGNRAGASVLVGGAAVGRANGRRVLCAGAVSGATGILLDSRVFRRGAGGEDGATSSSAVVAWLASQPGDVVIAMAASGWATATDETVDSGFEEALRALLIGGDGSGDVSDGGKSQASTAASNRDSWTLLGWKGAFGQNWTRRQYDASAGSKKGARCATYVELFLPPINPSTTPSSADTPGSAIKLTQIELKDRLCLTTLCSARAPAVTPPPSPPQADESTPSLRGSVKPSTAPYTAAVEEGPAFPTRGVCFRDGEPAVSVGPGVDLVDCKGWTTVLKGRAVRSGGSGGGGQVELRSAEVAAWRVTTVSAAVGGWHDDTEKFDDAAFGCPAFIIGGSPLSLPAEAPFLPAGRVREIVGWSGDNVNGVQVVYDVGGMTVRAPKHLGEHGLYRQSSLVLDVADGEVIEEITIQAGGLLDSLKVRTNKGKEKKWGGDGGDTLHTWHISEGQTFVGFHGGMGDHIHSLGVTIAEQSITPQGNERMVDAETAATTPGSTGANPPADQGRLVSAVTANLYSNDPVRRAYAQLLAYNTTTTHASLDAASGGDSTTHVAGVDTEVTSGTASGKPEHAALEEVSTAVETARKYADNLCNSPLDRRMSRIRLGNGFFDRKIGRLAGGGGLMRALGFRQLVDEDGRMQYVFLREGVEGVGGGLGGLRRARATLTDILAGLKSPTL